MFFCKNTLKCRENEMNYRYLFIQHQHNNKSSFVSFFENYASHLFETHKCEKLEKSPEIAGQLNMEYKSRSSYLRKRNHEVDIKEKESQGILTWNRSNYLRVRKRIQGVVIHRQGMMEQLVIHGKGIMEQLFTEKESWSSYSRKRNRGVVIQGKGIMEQLFMEKELWSSYSLKRNYGVVIHGEGIVEQLVIHGEGIVEQLFREKELWSSYSWRRNHEIVIQGK